MAATPADDAGAPQWSSGELKQLFARQQASQHLAEPQNSEESANIVGAAYRLPRNPGESADLYAKRVVKKRSPDHPNVKTGTWLLAAFRLFYDDASKRCATIARFEKDRNDRNYFEQKAKETHAIAEQAAKEVQLAVEGVEGYMAPLPTVDACDEVEKYGVDTTVRKGQVAIENMDRVKFVDDQPPPDAPRTAHGALREVYAAFWNFNKSNAMLGMYEATYAKSKGNVRLMIPGAAPAVYLNELAAGAVEAEMHTLRIMAMKNGTELCELRVPIAEAPSKKKKPKKGAPSAAANVVKCRRDLTMQRCVEHIAEEKKAGAIIFKAE